MKIWKNREYLEKFGKIVHNCEKSGNFRKNRKKSRKLGKKMIKIGKNWENWEKSCKLVKNREIF